jgi:uncharacterized protein YjbI with pentapeptide repeats
VNKPRGRLKAVLFWTGCLVGAAATITIAVLLLLPVSDTIAQHDLRGVPAAERAKELTITVDAARGRVLQVGGGLLAVIAFVYTARTFNLARRGHELSEQGQVTDRYTKAIDQLGSSKVDIRIGGLYALERVAQDSDRDHDVIMEVIAAFVRRATRAVPADATDWPPADIRAAMTVIARRDIAVDLDTLIDLHDADLHAINLPGLRLPGAMLRGVSLAGADLSGADLAGAILAGANLAGTRLLAASLKGADLTGAQMKEAKLRGANLAQALLSGADLCGADLTGADLTGATLDGADLKSAELGHATLDDATLERADLTLADLTSAKLRRVQGQGAKLGEATLVKADLGDAILTGANLAKAIIKDARLNGACLDDANLFDAVFAGSDLSGIDLTTLRLVGADLTHARIAPGATPPEGWERESPESPVLVRARRSAGR